jgi:hypothetical protein
VRWYQQQGKSVITWTALRPKVVGNDTVYVELQVPTHYQDQGSFLVDLAAPLKTALP